MAKVLQNFLIGVGLDTEQYDKGAKNVEGSLSRMRTLVGFTGAAITGAFAAAGTAAIAAGKRVDDFNLAAEKLKTPTADVYAYGRALASLGGDASEALTAINAAENALQQFQLKGTFGPFEEAAFAGVRDELNALMNARDGMELLRGLADVVPGMDKGQQRLIQDAFSLSDAAMRSLRGGTAELDASIARAGELYGEFGRATDAAREYGRAIAELNTRFEGIGETLAEKMLPGFTRILDSMGGFIDRNRGLIEESASYIGETPGAAALAAGAAVSATGVALRGIGMGGAGRVVSRLGYPGMVIGGGMMAYDAAKDWEWGDWWDQSKDSVRDSWRGLTGSDDVSDLPDAPYGPAVPVIGPDGAPIQNPIVESPTSGFITPYESIYGGGELDNAEAAKSSPDVIILRNQQEQAQRSDARPRIDVNNNLEVQLEIDGRAIDTRVVDVIERRERDTIDDIYSSVDR